MNGLKLLVALATMTALSVAALADEDIETRSKQQLGESWELTSHQTNVTHRFTHCTATTTYVATRETRAMMRARSLILMIKILADGTGRIDIGGDQWTLNPDKTYDVAFRFDDGQTFRVHGYSSTPTFVSADFNIDADWYKAMMIASRVRLSIENKSIGGYQLHDSFRALKELYACVARNVMLDNGTANSSKKDTFGDDQSEPVNSPSTGTKSTF